jgi:hypothetical protein
MNGITKGKADAKTKSVDPSRRRAGWLGQTGD